MTTQQLALTLLVALAASLPGLAAFWLWKRQVVNESAAYAMLREQMQEQIDALQKTNRFLSSRVTEMEQGRAREYAETEILRQETESLRQEVEELRRGVAELTRQLDAAKIPPAWTPPAKTPRRTNSVKTDLVALRQEIAEQFSLEEIGDLAFRLGVEPEDLSGSTIPAKARELISYLKDRGRVGELVELVNVLRPDSNGSG